MTYSFVKGYWALWVLLHKKAERLDKKPPATAFSMAAPVLALVLRVAGPEVPKARRFRV